MQNVSRARAGFSLVELSVVIVIIALLVGGVVAGQAILTASQMRAIYTDAQTYITAFKTFQDKYNYLPGDFPTATALWGTETNCPNNASTTRLTCNGDGNGHVFDYMNSVTWFEMLRAWQHLANAGMVPGSYTGAGAPIAYNNTQNAMPGVNVPKGKLDGSGYSLVYYPTGGGNMFTNLNLNQHVMFFGLSRIAAGAIYGGPTDMPILSATQAASIDNKIDDGYPGRGKLVTYTTSFESCANGTDTSATYNLTNPNKNACTLIFLTGF